MCTWEFLKIIGSDFVGGEMTGYRCRYLFIHLDGERKMEQGFLSKETTPTAHLPGSGGL